MKRQFMTKKEGYHHGDLRSALIAAGESTLQEEGIDGFSLRAVARKVGVSHSAPAHHFGDANGLLAAIAADGFRRLLRAMEKQHVASGPDAHAAFTGSGVGYVLFATASPATFGLMFSPSDLRARSAELAEAEDAAFEHLASNVETLTGCKRDSEPRLMQDILACWSMVHGLSDLMISGALKHLQSLPENEQIETFRAIISRTVPSSRP